MKLLVDNQLPVALARFFEAKGFECRHVREVGLSSAIDADIWEYARERGFVIVTKDEDFPNLAGRSGSGSPQIVWVRLGNCRKETLLATFEQVLPDLRAALAAGDTVIEIR